MSAIPYVIGQWVRGERFYGRTELIGEILKGPRDAIWVLGTRRIGKTSLLKQLEYLTAADPAYGFFPLFWDLQGADTPSELHGGFAEALLDAEDRFDELDLDAETLVSDDLFSSLRRLRRELRSRDQRLLLLCDEVEELVELHRKDEALLRKLRHALQASGEIRSVLTSTIKLWELAAQRDDTSPFLHGISPPAYISRMEAQEARALVSQDNLASGSRPSIAAADVEKLCTSCDNHPYLLQLVAKRLLESGTLEAAVEQVAADAMVSYFFSVDFEMLAPLERRLLRAVARDERAESGALAEALGAELPLVRGAIQHLYNLGFVRQRGASGVELANSFFRRWLTDLAPAATRLDPGEQTAAADRTTLAHLPPRSVLDDRYELQREVGEGATGIVYEAWDRMLRSRIAVKLLRSEYAGNQAVLERFRKEILLSRNLGHPNILRVYHLGKQDDRAYLTMQWVDGPTLSEAIAEAGRLPAERVAFVGSRLASALEAAHSYSVLHRDIKPQNIMLDKSGEPLLMDFGLARLMQDPGLTTTGVFLGTPNYVSPEQAAVEPLDERSDIYSLGVVLYEMATGRCPFSAETVADVLMMHRERQPEDPRTVADDVPPDLARIILRCLEKSPDGRFASAGELRSELESLLPEDRVPRPQGMAVSHLDSDSAVPAAEELLPLVYNELRRVARGYLARERPGHTLQPTALVHEAYMKLADQSRVAWAGRTHFLAVGAKVMRRLLIDHARTRGRAKRGGDQFRVTLNEVLTPAMKDGLEVDELLALDGAVEELAARNERQAQIVELRFYAGMTVAEVADYLGVSKRTVESDWTEAREWLRDRLTRD